MFRTTCRPIGFHIITFHSCIILYSISKHINCVLFCKLMALLFQWNFLDCISNSYWYLKQHDDHILQLLLQCWDWCECSLKPPSLTRRSISWVELKKSSLHIWPSTPLFPRTVTAYGVSPLNINRVQYLSQIAFLYNAILAQQIKSNRDNFSGAASCIRVSK